MRTLKRVSSVGVAAAARALLLLAMALLQVPQVRADPALTRGRILFLRCASCHDTGESASQKIGPNLYGIVGRKVASLPGYRYSPALAAQVFVWDRAQLDRWLVNPAALVPGTMMAFAGVDNAQDREAIIAYLSQPPAGHSP